MGETTGVIGGCGGGKNTRRGICRGEVTKG
jgi:hypothetical protein